MIDIQAEHEAKAKCRLVGAPSRDKNSEEKPLELMGLVDTLGMETLETITLARIEPNPVYGIGKGKAEEIADRAKELFADCIIFDFEIDPTKQRNWEKLTGINVFDRNEVILRIFAQRAKTREACLQCTDREARGRMILMATHDLAEAEFLGARVVPLA